MQYIKAMSPWFNPFSASALAFAAIGNTFFFVCPTVPRRAKLFICVSPMIHVAPNGRAAVITGDTHGAQRLCRRDHR